VPAVAAVPVTVSAALLPEFNEVMSQAIVSVLVFEQPDVGEENESMVIPTGTV
jgi:hypothetical protein